MKISEGHKMIMFSVTYIIHVYYVPVALLLNRYVVVVVVVESAMRDK